MCYGAHMSEGWNESEIAAFEERQFYLEEFRGRALLIAMPDAALAAPNASAALATVLRTLMANGTRVVLLVGASSPAAEATTERLCEVVRLTVGEKPAGAEPARFHRADATSDRVSHVVARAWESLRRTPLFVACVEAADAAGIHAFGSIVAGRMRVHKLVLIDAAGGLSGSDGRVISFLDESALAALLAQGEAEWTGLAARLEVVGSAREALLRGVASVNVCGILGMARELFTYEGSGTLFTLRDYCSIERLGIDDFEEAERLIERGQREGVLKPRTPTEIALLIANGYGATIATHHLAGFCAFISDPYRDHAAGEIVGLYTITRFTGEGVGDRLLDRAISDARASNLRFVFATTASAKAEAFFLRRGFVRVGADAVPPAKWEGYDSERKGRVAVLRFELTGGTR